MAERPANPLVVAVDVADLDRAERLAVSLREHVAMLKVGLELFAAAGPPAVERLKAHAPVFLDLKLHDIPNTVGRAATVAGKLGASLLTVHALGGPDMVAAAVEGAHRGAEEVGAPPPRVVAVTVLSSLAEAAGASPASLAFEAVRAGAAGAVVSGDDVRDVRDALGAEPVLVVPGIRPAGVGHNDHARVLTPEEALERGADYLVVGRPITEAPDPASVASLILRSVGR